MFLRCNIGLGGWTLSLSICLEVPNFFKKIIVFLYLIPWKSKIRSRLAFPWLSCATDIILVEQLIIQLHVKMGETQINLGCILTFTFFFIHFKKVFVFCYKAYMFLMILATNYCMRLLFCFGKGTFFSKICPKVGVFGSE